MDRQGSGRAGAEAGTEGPMALLTVVDPRHGRHPEVGVVLVVERVAIPIHRMVEKREVPAGGDSESERAGRSPGVPR